MVGSAGEEAPPDVATLVELSDVLISQTAAEARALASGLVRQIPVHAQERPPLQLLKALQQLVLERVGSGLETSAGGAEACARKQRLVALLMSNTSISP